MSELTRRESITHFARSLAVQSALVGPFLPTRFTSTTVEAPHQRAPLPSLEPKEEGRLLDGILRFRGALGFNTLPWEVEARMAEKRESWGRDNTGLFNDSVTRNRLHGKRSNEIVTKVFGEDAGLLFAGAGTPGEAAPYLFYFNPADRKAYYGWNVEDQYPLLGRPNDIAFNELVLHEELGHGTDPMFAPELYPYSTLLRVSHGQWQMLASLRTPEGYHFFAHDKYNRGFDYEMGRRLIRLLRSTPVDNPNRKSIADQIYSIMDEADVQVGRKISVGLTYKEDISAIGSVMLRQVFRDGTLPQGQLLDTYRGQFEAMSSEIYSNMTERVFGILAEIHPQVTDGYRQIIEGITRKKANIPNIKESVRKMPTDMEPSHVFELKRRARGEWTEEEQQFIDSETKIERFMQNAELPDDLPLSEYEKHWVKLYATAVATFVSRYPQFGHLGFRGLKFFSGFNPDLDFEDSEKLSGLISVTSIRNLFDTLYDRKKLNLADITYNKALTLMRYAKQLGLPYDEESKDYLEKALRGELG